MFFDTHCHFDSLDDALQQISSAYEAGVRGINVIGCDLETTNLSVLVVEKIESEKSQLGLDDLFIKATVGLHPHEAKHFEDQKDELEKVLENHSSLVSGIGETGFDFYYNHSDRDEQTRSFQWQLDLAKSSDKVLVIHTRDAWEDTFSLLDRRGWHDKTILHCFTGGVKEAKRVVENGGYISISGIATFKNAVEIQEAIVSVPLQNLLCETDAPWLAPAPFRGKPNEPSYVKYVVDKIVDLRVDELGEDRDLIVESLFENARKLFTV